MSAGERPSEQHIPQVPGGKDCSRGFEGVEGPEEEEEEDEEEEEEEEVEEEA